MNPYDILGGERTATAAEIKAAFKQRSMDQMMKRVGRE
jgi:curved DNA-binding protein CbpA